MAVVALLGLVGCGPLLGLDEDVPLLPPVGEAPVECSVPADCDDQNPCTRDSCDLLVQSCQNLPFDDGLAPPTNQTLGDCSVLHCAGGEPLPVYDEQDPPLVATACSTSSCSEEAGPETATVERGNLCIDGFCDGSGSCVECLDDSHCADYDTCGGGGLPGRCGCTVATCEALDVTCGAVRDTCGGYLVCDNAQADGNETDIDCGGESTSCATRCSNGRTCAVGGDCLEGYCADELCFAPWSLGFGDEANQRVNGLASDSGGDVVAVGNLQGSVDFGKGLHTAPAGGRSFFVAKFSATGSTLWSRSFCSSGMCDGTAVAIDNGDNILVTGSVEGTVDFGAGDFFVSQPKAFVLKLDKNGQTLWHECLTTTSTQHATTPGSWGLDVAVDENNKVAITGKVVGLLNNVQNAGGVADQAGDLFVSMLDAAGNSVFHASYKGPGLQKGNRIKVSSKNGLWVAGEMSGQVDFGGGGMTATQASRDAFLLRLDATGGHVFSKTFGESDSQAFHALDLSENGNVVVAADVNGSIDFGGGLLVSAGGSDVGVAAFDGFGNYLWGRLVGDTGDQHVADLVVKKGGEVALVGSFNGALNAGPVQLQSAGSFDVFVLGLGNQGVEIYGHRMGDPSSQMGRAIALTRNQSTFIGGEFHGQLSFNGLPLTAAGAGDMFVTVIPAH